MGWAVFLVGLAMAAVMSAGWLVQRRLRNAGWADVFWTYGTGVTLAAAALAPSVAHRSVAWRPIVVAVLLLVWAGRLGTYVALRVLRGAEDARYKGFRRDWGVGFNRNMFGLMIVQAPATALLTVSVALAAWRPGVNLRVADVIGALVLVAAILGEGVADAQMHRFKADPANQGRVCDHGLWSWSRHPNYLFEALGWFAYPIIAFDASEPWSIAAVSAPLFMLALLRWGTGVPPLEAAMIASKGQAYLDYQARVSALLPRPPRATKEPAR